MFNNDRRSTSSPQRVFLAFLAVVTLVVSLLMVSWIVAEDAYPETFVITEQTIDSITARTQLGS